MIPSLTEFVKEKEKTSSVDVKVDGNLKSIILQAGERVSVDHFESRLKGLTFTFLEELMQTLIVVAVYQIQSFK